MEFFQVVKHIDSPHPIYGMQARGTDGSDEPLDRIEDMAQFHLDAIRTLQPKGPYFLVGYSLGGLVTLEIARLLSQTRESVALLALLESYPARRFVPLEQRVRLAARVAARHALNMLELPVPDAVSYFLRPSERLSHFSRNERGRLYRHPPTGVWSTAAMQRVRDSGYLALQRYRPSFYDGKIAFVAARESSEFPNDPVAVWGKLVGKLTVETTPGDHYGIITTHFTKSGGSCVSLLARSDLNARTLITTLCRWSGRHAAKRVPVCVAAMPRDFKFTSVKLARV